MPEDLLGEVISPAADEGALLGTINTPEAQTPQHQESPLPTPAEENKPDEVNTDQTQAQTEQALAST